jgi:hypothetical protein
MPKEKVNDLITDQEIAFARLILAGEMSDQQAAEAAGLNPSTAAYTKAKPRVQEWMQQYRAAMDALILEQEAEILRRRSATRERVLNRLWSVADLAPEQTRNNMASQMKALAMIVAIEELIPDRRSAPAQKSSAPVASANIYKAAWLRQQDTGASPGSAPEPSHAPATEEDQQESAPAALETAPRAPIPSQQPGPDSAPGDPIVPHPLTFAEMNSSPYTSFVPDTRGSFHLPKNPFARRRR